MLRFTGILIWAPVLTAQTTVAVTAIRVSKTPAPTILAVTPAGQIVQASLSGAVLTQSGTSWTLTIPPGPQGATGPSGPPGPVGPAGTVPTLHADAFFISCATTTLCPNGTPAQSFTSSAAVNIELEVYRNGLLQQPAGPTAPDFTMTGGSGTAATISFTVPVADTDVIVLRYR